MPPSWFRGREEAMKKSGMSFFRKVRDDASQPDAHVQGMADNGWIDNIFRTAV
jgi:hypothetical protein